MPGFNYAVQELLDIGQSVFPILQYYFLFIQGVTLKTSRYILHILHQLYVREVFVDILQR